MNQDYVDLHIHSTCSDGHFSPREIVTLAARSGLVAIALADHDNIDGIRLAAAEAEPLGIEVISGVELSSQWKDFTDLHLLGYGFDVDHPELNRELRRFQDYRAGRNLKIIEAVNRKLAGEGKAAIDPARVRHLAGGTIGRPHIAQALRLAGYVGGNDEAFTRYLVPCNVPKYFFPADEAIRLVHAAGGIAVLAHPPYVTRDRRSLETLVAELVELGLDGIEAYNNGSGLEETDWLIRLARRHQLVVTGGSDFHGEPDANIVIGYGLRGIRVPYDCVDEINSALARRRGQPL